MSTGWVLDKGRFAEEVLRPVAEGWDVHQNLFRLFQLPLDVLDDETINTAIHEVDAHLKWNSLQGPHLDTASALRHVISVVEDEMRETARRKKHRQEVSDRWRKFATKVRGDMGGMPALRVDELEALVLRNRKRFTRREVEEALATEGVEVRDPVPFEIPLLPTRWPDLKRKLRRLGHPSLDAYLARRGLGPGATTADVARERANLDRTASGELLGVAQSVLVAVDRLVTSRKLAAALHRELVDELIEAAEQDVQALDALLDQTAVQRRARVLGLPERADLAYAVLCRARPLEHVQSAWRPDYEQAVADRDLRAQVDVLQSQPNLAAEWSDVLVQKRADLAGIDAELAAAAAEEFADPERAAARYLAVLRDTLEPAAEAGLLRCRPPAPATTWARVEGDRVRVEWTPAAVRSGSAVYRVDRRVDRGPRAGRERIGETEQTWMLDEDVPGGVEVHYEVTTLRSGAASAHPAPTAPLVALPAVADLIAEAGDGEVRLRWRLPQGAVAVRLRRTRGGASVGLATGTTTAHDPRAQSGEHYVYAVEAAYDVGGERRYAAAAVVDAHPQAPPEPVEDLSVAENADGASAVAAWTDPASGSVVLWVMHRPPPEPGTLLRADIRLGESVTLLGRDPAGVRIELPAEGRRRWVVPVTVAGELAAVGRAVEHDRRLPAVAGLRAVRQGHQVRLTWEWPQRAAEARVLVRTGHQVGGPVDPMATVTRISRALYDRSGCRLPVEAGTEAWFAVCVTAYDEGQEVHGPITQTSVAAPAVVGYAIVELGRERRRLDVTGPAPLPTVQLRARAGLPPLTPEDGTALVTLPPPDPDATTMSMDFDLIDGRPLHLRAFAMCTGVELRPEDSRQLRVDRRRWWR